MFMIDYVYVPLSGKSYVASDMCHSFVVEEFNDEQMRLEFSHAAFDLEQKRVNFTTFVIIPRQRISVAPIKDFNNAEK